MSQDVGDNRTLYWVRLLSFRGGPLGAPVCWWSRFGSRTRSRRSSTVVALTMRICRFLFEGVAAAASTGEAGGVDQGRCLSGRMRGSRAGSGLVSLSTELHWGLELTQVVDSLGSRTKDLEVRAGGSRVDH